MIDQGCSLVDAWALRNAAADTLVRSDEHLRRLVETASVEQLARLIETFAPTRSRGPEWTRTLDPLLERLWAWATPQTMAELEATFRSRGKAWAAMANSFAAERGAELREEIRRPSWARHPAFTVA